MDVTYLDYNASSLVPPETLGELERLAKSSLGNPSSLHSAGRMSRRFINEATEIISSLLSSKPESIYWTSGATEANSWVFHSIARAAQKKSKHPRVVLSAIEHESTLLAAEYIGAEVFKVRALSSGQVDVTHLEEILDQNQNAIDIVSVLHSNNETGVIQPIEEISALCEKAKAPLHVDCVQSFGRIPLDLSKFKADYCTFSGHKLGALKGIGFLILSSGAVLSPLIHGKQQRAKRGGTENAFLAAVLSQVLKQISGTAYAAHLKNLKTWHLEFEARLKKLIPGLLIHGESAPRLPNTSFVGFEDVDGDSVLLNLDMEGICASSGSACTTGTLNPSHVLLAMGLSPAVSKSSVRFSSGILTKAEDFERVLKTLPQIVKRVRTQ